MNRGGIVEDNSSADSIANSIQTRCDLKFIYKFICEIADNY